MCQCEEVGKTGTGELEQVIKQDVLRGDIDGVIRVAIAEIGCLVKPILLCHLASCSHHSLSRLQRHRVAPVAYAVVPKRLYAVLRLRKGEPQPRVFKRVGTDQLCLADVGLGALGDSRRIGHAAMGCIDRHSIIGIPREQGLMALRKQIPELIDIFRGDGLCRPLARKWIDKSLSGPERSGLPRGRNTARPGRNTAIGIALNFSTDCS